MRATASSRRLVVFAALLLLLAGSAQAKKGKAPTEPGSYRDWNGEIDQLTVVRSFSFADYQRLVVGDFDTSDTPLPERDDNTWEPVQKVLADVASPLVEALANNLEGTRVSAADGAAPTEKGTLILRGKVLEMDPGSRAARYWGGFGAGAARTKLECELVDAASGDVLLRFTQERRSGVGVGGGGYVDLLQRNLRTIGRDLAEALPRF
jgi:hypothetical protein